MREIETEGRKPSWRVSPRDYTRRRPRETGGNRMSGWSVCWQSSKLGWK